MPHPPDSDATSRANDQPSTRRPVPGATSSRCSVSHFAITPASPWHITPQIPGRARSPTLSPRPLPTQRLPGRDGATRRQMAQLVRGEPGSRPSPAACRRARPRVRTVAMILARAASEIPESRDGTRGGGTDVREERRGGNSEMPGNAAGSSRGRPPGGRAPPRCPQKLSMVKKLMWTRLPSDPSTYWVSQYMRSRPLFKPPPKL